jgi:hypothetical protein
MPTTSSGYAVLMPDIPYYFEYIESFLALRVEREPGLLISFSVGTPNYGRAVVDAFIEAGVLSLRCAERVMWRLP